MTLSPRTRTIMIIMGAISLPLMGRTIFFLDHASPMPARVLYSV